MKSLTSVGCFLPSYTRVGAFSPLNTFVFHLLFFLQTFRVKKLKETFAFIQQLDKNMSNLRTWLARIESELSKPVVYDVCDDQEIQKRLAEQQVGKRDVSVCKRVGAQCLRTQAFLALAVCSSMFTFHSISLFFPGTTVHLSMFLCV